MSTNGVSNCYVFKSRLQEYAQRVGIATPVYNTIKEGPSHQPSFRSTVVVNDIRYDSLLGFYNRKAAEQSAAEVALLELAKSGVTNESITLPVHETGLCKNLLQEYAQKMNYAMPSYECKKDDKKAKDAHFSCTVDIGGTKYVGAAARTKKEAELKAARTALLAIQMTGPASTEKLSGDSIYTVLPMKRGKPDLGTSVQEIAPLPKRRKGRFHKKQRKRRVVNYKFREMGGTNLDKTGQAVMELSQGDGFSDKIADSNPIGTMIPCGNVNAKYSNAIVLGHEQNGLGYNDTTFSSSWFSEACKASGPGQTDSVVKNASEMSREQVLSGLNGFNEAVSGPDAG